MSLNKIGATEAVIAKLHKLHIQTIWDLALHFPLRYEDETHITPIQSAPLGKSCLVEGTVIKQEVQYRPRKQLLVQIEDRAGFSLILRFIHFYPSHLQQLAEGKKVRALGEIRHGYYGDEMIHPKVKSAENTPLEESLTPIYPTVSGLSQATLRKLINKAITLVDLSDTLPAELLSKLNLADFKSSLLFLHAPTPEYSLDELHNENLPAWQRLKFDELLAQQLSMRLAREKLRNELTHPLKSTGKLINKLIAQLPFKLTNAQTKVIKEIKTDLQKPYPMHRLLQGDVGSGKTIVAAISALMAIESGFQVALVAPTEILAEQHYLKFKGWFESLGIAVSYLSGSQKKKEKALAKEKITDGEIKLVIGTHAVFQEDVNFLKLGLIIVDEQHRFGVLQRLALKNKGQSVHQLMMSATPIPRTLAMSFFADLDVSVIDELPPNRTAIQTKLINQTRRAEVEQFVQQFCQNKQQVYWVCPLIEESETLQLQTAVDTHQNLQTVFPELKIGLVHGRMKANEKTAVMNAFSQGDLDILVATTVIEVGVDVPNASLMVIEHAERMGLSQLHQLRGRVGRGKNASTCILLFNEPLSDLAKARLKVIYQNTDGFAIAREDLNIRGPGEFLGAKQSGIPLLRFANLTTDLALLEQARDIAPKLIEHQNKVVEQHLHRWLANKESYLGV